MRLLSLISYNCGDLEDKFMYHEIFERQYCAEAERRGCREADVNGNPDFTTHSCLVVTSLSGIYRGW